MAIPRLQLERLGSRHIGNGKALPPNYSGVNTPIPNGLECLKAVGLALADDKLYKKGNKTMKNTILKVIILTIISITLSHAEFKKNSKNESLKQPTLHLLTITLDNYKNSNFNLRYCNSDADAIAKAFKNNGAKLYKSVQVYSLRDNQVTKKNVKEMFQEIAKKIDKKDTFVLYVDGHGLAKNNKFYFVSYNANLKNLDKTAIDEKIFIEGLSSISAKHSLFLIDSSESSILVNNIASKVHINMIASSTGNQSAIDGYKKHGLFTYVILEAMKDKKVYGLDNKLSVSEMAYYIQSEQPRLAKEAFNHKQEPTVYLSGGTFFIGEI